MNIIFDLDGTLVDSQSGVVKALEHVINRHNGLMPIDTRNLIGPPLRTIIESCLKTEDPSVIEKVAEDFKVAYDGDFYKQTAMYPGVEKMLASLQSCGHRLLIATNKRATPTKKILEFLKIKTFFNHVYCVDTFPHVGTKGKLLQKIFIELNIDPKSTMYIGDRDEDAFAAKTANVKFFHVNWGYGDESEDTDSISHCAELTERIKNYASSY